MEPNILLAIAIANKVTAKAEPKALHQPGCRVLALFGPKAMSAIRSRSGVKRKSNVGPNFHDLSRKVDFSNSIRRRPSTTPTYRANQRVACAVWSAVPFKH